MARTLKQQLASAWFALTSSQTAWTSSRFCRQTMDASLCQDVALLLHLAQLPAQPHQLLAPGWAQAFHAGQRFAAIAAVLGDPVRDALRGGAELTRELRANFRRAPAR